MNKNTKFVQMPDYLGLDGQRHTGRMARLTNRKAATGAVYIQEIRDGKKVLKSIVDRTAWGWWFKYEGAAARQIAARAEVAE